MGCGGSKEGGRDQPSLIHNNVRKAGPATFKVVLLGDKAVGKSSIVFRYTQDKFSESHELTIGAAFVSKDVTLTGATGTSQLRLHIWDTAGEEAYRSMTRFFYREAAAGIIVYDVTSRASFQAVQSWVADFREQCPDATVIVAGNKIDCPNRAVTKEEGVSYAEKNNMRYIECSAKANTGVSELFQCVGELLVDSGDSSAQA